jgi:hypothetical protein
MFTQIAYVQNRSVQVLLSIRPILKLVLIFFFCHFKKDSEVLAQLNASSTTFPNIFAYTVVAMAAALGIVLFIPWWTIIPEQDKIDDIFNKKMSSCAHCPGSCKIRIWIYFQRLAKISVVVGAVSAFAGVMVEIMFISSSSAAWDFADLGQGFYLSVSAMIILLMLLLCLLIDLCRRLFMIYSYSQPVAGIVK